MNLAQDKDYYYTVETNPSDIGILLYNNFGLTIVLYEFRKDCKRNVTNELYCFYSVDFLCS